MATLTEMRDLVKAKVKDTSTRFSDTEKENFVKEAIRQFNRDVPRVVDDVLTGDGSTQTHNTPNDWVDGFSYIKALEYPVDQEPIRTVDVQDHVLVIQRSNVEKIQLLSIVIPNAETARVFFAVPHSESTPTTIVGVGIDAVVNLAASKLCNALAAFYAEDSEPTLGIDVVDRSRKAEMFRSMGDRFKKEYVAIISPKADDALGAEMTHVDQDIAFSWNHSHLTHPPKNR